MSSGVDLYVLSNTVGICYDANSDYRKITFKISLGMYSTSHTVGVKFCYALYTK